MEALAERAGMSARSFARRFAEAVGSTPARHVRALRVDAARRLLTEGRLPVARVADRCGFPSEEAMRVAFQRDLGVAPRDFRARFASAGPRPQRESASLTPKPSSIVPATRFRSVVQRGFAPRRWAKRRVRKTTTAP